MIDHTHAGTARSWVDSANGHASFPLQNLPLGVFSPGGSAPRCGVAIGDRILDLQALAAGGHLPETIAEAVCGPTLNPLLAMGRPASRTLRHAVFELLSEDRSHRAGDLPLHEAKHCQMCLPAIIGGYTDFYAGIVHATNVGKLFRPDNPLLPNYKYVPIGYHGRPSSIRPSGTPIRRPNGQIRTGQSDPVAGPARQLDYEVELGIWIGSGNALGVPIPISEAGEHIAGISLLNDWSARDIQAWEYQPLGPFLAKNFATTISPWIVTAEALAPFRAAQMARPPGDPAPLPYLLDARDQAEGALAIQLEIALQTAAMREAGQPHQAIAWTAASHLYWTPAQMVAHHSSNGCNLEPGDLLGTGTISAPEEHGYGSLLETTSRGERPIRLANGEERRFLEDGDEVVLTGRCSQPGFASIGFGECRATVLPAPSPSASNPQ
ncbi:MAG: fumarylacetoacetase [Paludibacterium sp.]|uniref:fumarylacetoacetase n=1 Tax=Paludibacterium sp. TaxID=1917523 RepID=UPI0025E4938F|nr:fumarylacetoacetase [Paludibacterium sp.]MBV8048260.1 fumarylacetoacetase [Paludibacterium sp.]